MNHALHLLNRLTISGIMILLLSVATAGAASNPLPSAAGETASGLKVAPKVKVGKDAMTLPAAAEINEIGFRTENDGRWTATYEVANTGGRTWNPREIQYRSSQILQSGGREAIHSVNTDHTIPPGNTIRGAYDFPRCATASKFQLDILYNGQQIATRQENVPPIEVRIARVVAGKDNKSLDVTLNNSTSYRTRITVKAISERTPLEKNAIGKFSGSAQTVIEGNSSQQVTVAVDDAKAVQQVVALFVDEKKCNGPGYVVVDRKRTSSGIHAGSGSTPNGPGVIVESIVWHRPSKTWTATVRNRDPYNSVEVGISGFPMENGVPGMTIWSNETIGANDTVQLVGDYSSFNVPVGTRLKVHVLLKPSNTKVHEKIIVLD